LVITFGLITGLAISGHAQAASGAAQPVLKAIDPSAAKLDAPPPPEATVDPGRKFNQSNPFNSGIQGRPLGSPPGALKQFPTGMLSPQFDQAQSSPVNPVDEQRVTRLEKQAFGNTYPEHEVEDRLEHLEKEVLGGKRDGQTVERIARLEQKLLGGTAFGGAFGGTALGQAAVPSSYQASNLTPVNMSGSNYIPVPATAYPPPVAQFPSNQPQYSNSQPQFANSQPQYGSPSNFQSPNQSLPNQTSPNQLQAQRPQIPGNHLPPGQVAMPQAWSTQPNFSPRAYGPGPSPSPVPGASPVLVSGSLPGSRPGSTNLGNTLSTSTNHGANTSKVMAPNRSQATSANANPNSSSVPVRVAQNTASPNYSPANYSPSNYSPAPPTASSLTIDAAVVANSLNYDGQAGDYLGAIRRLSTGNNGTSVYAHWRQFPVRVRLPLGSPESWQRNLESVIARWDQYVPVKIALPHEPSNVDVLWVNQLPPKALGVCRLNIVNGQMQIWVYLLRPSFYAADVPERTLAAVFTREMGHALGLFGKSEKNSDLMYAAENGSSNISVLSTSASAVGAKKKAPIKFPGIGVRDINTLKRVYEAPSTPFGLSLEQPLEWATSY
jgi:predicted Zn-dependent protease